MEPSMCVIRVPAAPGKPGKAGPDLENLEKHGGFLGKNHVWMAEIYGDLGSRSNCVSPPGAR